MGAAVQNNGQFGRFTITCIFDEFLYQGNSGWVGADVPLNHVTDINLLYRVQMNHRIPLRSLSTSKLALLNSSPSRRERYRKTPKHDVAKEPDIALTTD
jgi:hypothetical protein